MSVFRQILDGDGALLARDDLRENLLGHLRKPSPDHMSVIGPKLSGKTPLLRAVCEQLRRDGTFDGVVYSDLRHGAELSQDASVYQRLAEQLRDELKACLPDVSELLAEEQDQAALRLVFDYLEGEGKRLVVVLDGLDRVLASPSITRNLWDFLRSLAEKRSLTLVTGSRHRLRELCADPDARTSDFWNIFYETPVHVGALSDADWGQVLEALTASAAKLDGSAEKELRNWTGGIPMLVMFLCDRICGTHAGKGTVSKPDVDALAETVQRECEDHLATLWADCSARVQGYLVELGKNNEIPSAEVARELQQDLVRRGLATLSGSKLRSASRLMSRYAVAHGESVSDLKHLLGTREKLEANARTLLQVRLDGASSIDSEQATEIGRVIANLTADNGTPAAMLMRNVADAVLAKVMAVALPADGEVPADWLTEWQQKGVRDVPRANPPLRRGDRRATLRAMLDENTSCVAPIRFSTMLLLDYVYDIGNYGNHVNEMESESVPYLFMVNACLAAITLAEQLAEDLANVAP